ncbi:MULTISPECIES: response regulator transcription factor [Nocardia]|uniref:DNA-binding response OmpR family regulator n=1 Tax=Nocardia ignorata TaxID=145285 RepID=A0A4R6PK64_NOCIG|nr:response regulator transcription factor [Nocardia ignorata]MBC7302082.1 response regulator transcription factor [Nocardia sp.]TDP38547.1 DNA-binding response OmpR family regulator [Nocardia ignorata]
MAGSAEMSDPLTDAWESGYSQFQARRRACVTGTIRDRMTLLVVDDTDTARTLSAELAGQPVELRVCSDPAHALLVLGRTCPDAVLLGPTTGRLSPIDFLEILRAEEPGIPVLVAVGSGDGAFAAQAAEHGVTAVIPKPYRSRELLAILQSLALASEPIAIHPMVIDLGRLRIDGSAPRIWLDGEQIMLPPREFLLLRYLAERKGAVIPRKDLVRALWGEGPTSSNSLTVHVLRLRRRLGDEEHNPQWIRAIRRLGYQFDVPPRSPNVHRT